MARWYEFTQLRPITVVAPHEKTRYLEFRSTMDLDHVIYYGEYKDPGTYTPTDYVICVMKHDATVAMAPMIIDMTYEEFKALIENKP